MTTPGRGGICEWTEFGSSRVCGNPLPCSRHSTDHEGHPFGFTNLADRPTPTSETPAAPRPAEAERLRDWLIEWGVFQPTTTTEFDQRLDAALAAAALAARPALDVPLDRVLSELREEVGAARVKHAPMHSPHEGWAVILEELTPELWEHVCHDTGRSPEARKEALQVAAMGVRYILDLIDDPPARLAPQEPTPQEPR